jgi:pantetheine-phosphate adenylyltransferase
MKKFKKVAVGGTFDELHRGHKALINRAFEAGETVLIGLSSDAFVAKMGKPHNTASYEERRKELQAFLRGSSFAKEFEIVPLDDPFGSTISSEGLEALIVSQETLPTAIIINEKRERAGFAPLAIITVGMIPAENYKPISTTRIRSGEIDRNGHIIK